MSWATRWNETVKATALATLAERTATASTVAVDTPWNWSPHDVWLTRVKSPRTLADRASIREPSTVTRPDMAARP